MDKMRHSIGGALRNRSESKGTTTSGLVNRHSCWADSKNLGNRSSSEEHREAADDDVTVVEPDQGNGTIYTSLLRLNCVLTSMQFFRISSPNCALAPTFLESPYRLSSSRRGQCWKE